MFLSILLSFFLQIQKEKILFIGDSMTTYANGWQHQLSKKLNVDYDNFAVSGRRTDWMLSKLTEVLSKNKNYKICFIYGGINDGFSYVKIESATNNLQHMVDLCNKNDIKPVVIMGYNPKSVMVNVYVKNAEPFVNRYIQIQEKMSKLKDCKIIPIAEDITRKDSDDGVHFKSSGHQKLANWVFTHIGEIKP